MSKNGVVVPSDAPAPDWKQEDVYPKGYSNIDPGIKRGRMSVKPPPKPEDEIARAAKRAGRPAGDIVEPLELETRRMIKRDKERGVWPTKDYY